MPSVNDIGTPGAPMTTPPLTDWQEAVRDAFNGSDVTVDARIATATATASMTLVPNTGWTGQIVVRRDGDVVTLTVSNLTKAAPTANEPIVTIPVGYQPPTEIRAGAMPMFTLNVYAGSGKSELYISHIVSTFAAPIAGFRHYGSVAWITEDAWPA